MRCSPAPTSIYEVGGQRYEVGSPGFAEAIAKAHANHQRPRCLCQPAGVEMYIARLGDGFIVKRMPDTGSRHTPHCPSYEPPAESSGLGQVLGSAITEDPATGETTLKLDFPLTTVPGRAGLPPPGEDGGSAATNGTRLTLRGLLHYLWDQAELTRWHPGFAGKRTWATVRRHLLQAAQHKTTGGTALRERLYVPEPFSVDERAAINARRVAQWQRAQSRLVLAAPGRAQPLMLLIGEVKEIVPARYGHKAIVKHLPDQAFSVDASLFQRLSRRFEPQLALWGAAEDLHMVMIATFSVSSEGLPALHELSLMPVTWQWLPVEDGFEKQLIERLVADGRSFVKGLRYNLGRAHLIASATLTDCGTDREGTAPMLFIEPAAPDAAPMRHEMGDSGPPPWVWHRSDEPLPLLPPAASRSPSTAHPVAADADRTAQSVCK